MSVSAGSVVPFFIQAGGLFVKQGGARVSLRRALEGKPSTLGLAVGTESCLLCALSERVIGELRCALARLCCPDARLRSPLARLTPALGRIARRVGRLGLACAHDGLAQPVGAVEPSSTCPSGPDISMITPYAASERSSSGSTRTWQSNCLPRRLTASTLTL